MEKARSHASEAPERPCERQMEAALAMGRRVHERMRPNELGSHISGGRLERNSVMICCSSASSIVPSVTALRATHKLVLSRPDMVSAFQIAPVEGVSTLMSTEAAQRAC